MRYDLDTKVNKIIKDYSKTYLKPFLKYIVSKGEISSITNTRVQMATVALNVFMNNCYLHAIHHKNKLPIPLDKNVYSTGFIVNGRQMKDKVSYQYTRWLLDFVQHQGLGTYELGSREYTCHIINNKHQMKITDKVTIFKMMDDFKKELLELKDKIGFIQKKNVISLRDANGNPVKFKPNKYQVYMHNVVDRINSDAITIPIGKVNDSDFDTRMQLEKIWNITKERNGKMYTVELQSMPKKERLLLTIDKEPVVCLDYKCFETSLLYTMVGEKLVGDPYQVYIDGYDNKLLRDVGKMVMTRIYYAEDEFQLRSSINFDIANDYDLDKLVGEKKIPTRRIPVSYIVKELMNRHECVSEYFFGKGDVDPANLGSLVIDYVMDYMNQNYSEIVIPVYDEIICKESYEEIVTKLMREAFIHVVGTDSNCVIVAERRKSS